MSDNWTWQPVEEPIGPVELEIEYYTHGDSDTATHYDAGHLGGDWVSLGGDIVTTINWGAHEDYRLCRRVPQACSVPVEVAHAWTNIFNMGSPGGGFDGLWREMAGILNDYFGISPTQGQE